MQNEAIKEIGKQPLSTEMSTDEYEHADFDGGYGGCVVKARRTLAELERIAGKPNV